ncbi:Rrf2 family transcriptional regulator [Terrilactibacillus sp. S3-3]|nr:Rrf2 family transcriptional regulator [Terrilactibacillus sp. S3-3]
MKTNRIDQIGQPRFRIAVHALVGLSKSGGCLSSAIIASQVNSHATFLRRVLSVLNGAGIVDAKEGRDGGYSLKVPEDKLTLADIYTAIKCDERDPEPEDLDCGEAGRQLDVNLERIMNRAEEQMVEFLRQFTLADVMANLD